MNENDIHKQLLDKLSNAETTAEVNQLVNENPYLTNDEGAKGIVIARRASLARQGK